MQLPPGTRLECEFGVGDAIGSVVIWILLSIVTLGLATFVAPYYVYSAVLNKTHVVDAGGYRVAGLRVDFSLGEIIGHAVIWLILTIVTIGLALFVYYFMVMRKVISRTELVGIGTSSPAPQHWPDDEPEAPPVRARPGAVTAVR